MYDNLVTALFRKQSSLFTAEINYTAFNLKPSPVKSNDNRLNTLVEDIETETVADHI